MPKALYEVRNNENLRGAGRKALVRDLGKDAVVDAAPWMASKASPFQKLYPGSFPLQAFKIRTLDAANHHTPEFEYGRKGPHDGLCHGRQLCLGLPCL